MNKAVTKATAIKQVRVGYARGAPIPWQVKMALKIGLSSVPLSYRLLSALGIFRHGDITSKIGHLDSSFQDHLNAYIETYDKIPGHVLELGCGDSVGHALCAHFAGVQSLALIDVDDFATKDEGHYKAVYDSLTQKYDSKETSCPDSFNRDEVLSYCNSNYYKRGLESLGKLADNSLDFSFSHAVFEHIRRDEFAAHMRELYRVHKSGTLSRHWVDLHDHLGGALNSFRFAPNFWEGKMVGRAGFYTNRLTMDEMINMAEEAGFKVSVKKIIKWEDLPTPRQAMHAMFDGKEEKELNICTFLMHMIKE